MTSKSPFVLATILVLSSLASFGGAECPLNFLQLHNKCYYFSNDIDSWDNSHFRCNSLNATLITLKSKHNDKRLVDYLRHEHLGTKEWWIGARYDWMQRQWKWGATGKPVKFNHFIRAATHKGKLDWHCAFLDQRHQFQWNADPCHRKKFFICMQNDLDYHGAVDDKDNQIPVIVTRDLLEEQHLKNDSQPAFILAPGSTASSLRPKGNPRPGRPQHRYVCPAGYGYVRNSCYKFSKTLATWQDAYFSCADEPNVNGTLAIIPDKKYDRGIRRYAKRIGANAHERWIGGIYDWQKTAWKWAANGVIIQHREREKEKLRWHCLIWSPLLTDKWTSDSCVLKKHYICQASPKILVPMVPMEMNRRPRPTAKSPSTKNKRKQASLEPRQV